MSKETNWVTVSRHEDVKKQKRGENKNYNSSTNSNRNNVNGKKKWNRNHGRNVTDDRGGKGQNRMPRDHNSNNRSSSFTAAESQQRRVNQHQYNPVVNLSNKPLQPPKSALQRQAMGMGLNVNPNVGQNDPQAGGWYHSNFHTDTRNSAQSHNVNTSMMGMGYSNNASLPNSQFQSHNPFPPLQTYTKRTQEQNNNFYQNEFPNYAGTKGNTTHENKKDNIGPNSIMKQEVRMQHHSFPDFPPLSKAMMSPPQPAPNFNNLGVMHSGSNAGNNIIQHSQPSSTTNHGGWAQIPGPQSYHILHHADQLSNNKNNNIKANKGTSNARRGNMNMNNAQKPTSLGAAISSHNQNQPIQRKRQQPQPNKKRPKSKPKETGARMHPKAKGKNNNFLTNSNNVFPPSTLDHKAATFSFLHANNTLPMGVLVKGKQKIGKRKKILTPLKKQILKERLATWRARQNEKEVSAVTTVDEIVGGESPVLNTENGPDVPIVHKSVENQDTSIVFLKGYVHPDELEDEDEFLEIQHDLRTLAEKVGTVSSVCIPQKPDSDNSDNPVLAYVLFQDSKDAQAAKACWNGMILGGQEISVGTIPQKFVDEIQYDPSRNDSELSLMEIVGLIPSSELVTLANQSSLKSQYNTQPVTTANRNVPAVIVLTNVLTEDDLEDTDCMEETLQDVKDLAAQYGPLSEEKECVSVNMERKEVLVRYQCLSDAKFGLEKLHGSILGGATISARLESLTAQFASFTVYLENILSQDDYEDEECLEATREDIEVLASNYGSTKDIHVELNGINKGRVSIVYPDLAIAERAVLGFDGIVIGGLTVKSWLMNAPSNFCDVQPSTLILQSILSEDDLKDEECLEETKSDILQLLEKYGKVQKFDIHLDGSEKSNISVVFNDRAITLEASNELDGMIFGGDKIRAVVLPDARSNMTQNISSTNKAPVVKEEKKEVKDSIPKPMYSGDKVIPEQYAECKRVPKIPNAGVPRDYAKQMNDESVIPLLFEMLGELMRLQLRAKETKNAKARRRLVMGLREVARGIRARKVKMIVMANNLDQYGALDVKLQEILDLAKEHELPVIFELNKRKIGKALGKSIKVSVVGIENADGAHESFKKLKKLYS